MTMTHTCSDDSTVTGPAPATPTVPLRGRLRPLGQDEVAITGGFWGQRQAINASATLAHIEHWLEREGWLANFDLAGTGDLWRSRRGREFSDSEVYKYLEALAWEIGRSDDPQLEATFRATVRRVVAAQEPDGYLNTRFGRPGQEPRWSDLQWGHELYCAGHLVQAAVARARTRPGADDGLLEAAVRNAQLICEMFGKGRSDAVCGHPEIEPALVELARVTGERRYLEQAAVFLDRRGRGSLGDIEFGRAYYQDDVPVREADALRGHAVRAGYLSAGAVDVAVDTGDEALLAALVEQWDHTVARRTYLTGGQGSHHQDEAFGEDWELPPDRAYSETCAGIASIMFSWRLLLATGEPRYADLIERTLFNVIATAVSADGREFFYTNTLHQRRPGVAAATDTVSPRASSSLRAPWFDVSCCPPNIARTFAALACYLATADDDGVQLHQYAPATIDTTLPDGRVVALDVTTSYPDAGAVRVRVRSTSDRPWALTLRVPSWADDARLTVETAGGESTSQGVLPGTVTLRRAFGAGDVITLHLPVEPRWSAPDPRIDAVRGCVALERGPVVYCLESVDLGAAPGAGPWHVDDVQVDRSVAPRDTPDGVVVSLTALAHSDRSWPYQPAGDRPAEARTTITAPLLPYHAWAERGPATMRVWLPTAGPELG